MVEKQKFDCEHIQTWNDRIKHNNKNLLVTYVGETGGGKSWACLRTGEVLDKTFNIDRVVFSPSDFLHLITTKQIKKGQIAVLEELGVNLSARDFWREQNKKIIELLQTFRHRNFGVLFNVPNMTYIDVNSRRLMHYMVNMQGISQTQGCSYAKIYKLKTDARTGDVLTIFPRYEDEYGQYVSGSIQFRKPSVKLRNQYEAKKEAWSDKLTIEIESFLAKTERKEKSKSVDVHTLSKIIIDKGIPDELYNKRIQKGERLISASELAVKYNLGSSMALRLKNRLDSHLRKAGLSMVATIDEVKQ